MFDLLLALIEASGGYRQNSGMAGKRGRGCAETMAETFRQLSRSMLSGRPYLLLTLSHPNEDLLPRLGSTSDLVAWISRLDAMIPGPLGLMQSGRSSGVLAPACG